MARRKITIDEKIERQTEIVARAKEKYESALDELEKLISSREDIYKEDIIKAYESSGRTYKEVMEFLSSKTKKK
jgi:exonuclease VII small subunit